MIQVQDFEYGMPLDLYIRTKARYAYSYIESAALKIGEEVFEVFSFGGYALNGVTDSHMDGTLALAGFPITVTKQEKKESSFEILLGPDESITFSTFKDLVSVKVNGGSSDHFEDAVGLMGTYDGKMVTRNGTIVNELDPNAFGQEWQVLENEPMIFMASRAAQHPHELCRLPSSRSQKKRRLGESIAQEAAENACAHVMDVGMKAACVYDVLAVGDLEIAKSGSYD